MKRLDGKPRVFNQSKKLQKFLQKAVKKHGDKYDYSNVVYTNCKVPVEIICKEHGSFLQTPDNHINLKHGCAFCGKNKGGVKYTTNDVVEQFIEIHGDLYDYSLVEYKNSSGSIKIICKKHGCFEQLPSVHKMGSGCPKCVGKCLSQDELLLLLENKNWNHIKYIDGLYNKKSKCNFYCEKHGEFTKSFETVLNSKHGCTKCSNKSIGVKLRCDTLKIEKTVNETGKFDFVSARRSGTKWLVTVKCNLHDTVEERPYYGIKSSVGCSKCLFEYKQKDRLYSTEDFIKKASAVHDFKYSYETTVYKTSRDKVTVTCPIHGNFLIGANKHMMGGGCKQCTVRSNWSKEGFVNFSKSKYGGKATLYLIECYNNSENFIKVGRTCRTTKERFSHCVVMPYDYKIIMDVKLNADIVYDVEKRIKRSFKQHSYKPIIDFGGKTECFHTHMKDNILNFMKEMLDGH